MSTSAMRTSITQPFGDLPEGSFWRITYLLDVFARLEALSCGR